MGLIRRLLIVIVVVGLARAAGAQTGPVTGAPPPQHVICDSGCTGAVGGSTGQTTMANASSVVIASDQSAVPVTGTFWQATQPVSLASVPSHAVTNAGTFAVQVTSAPTTAVTGTFWQATQPVSGTFWQATQPVSGTFWQATQPVSGTVTANAGSGTFTVSGTVTANAGSGPFPVSDNAGSLTVDAPVGTPVFVRLSDGAAAITTLPVSLSGNQAVNLAQVAGATVQTGNGTAAGAQRVSLASDSTGQVTLATGANTIGAISNTSFTANAGTNLNTSALALESGGNLTAIRTSVETIDNFISGSRGLVTEDNSATISSTLTTLNSRVATAAKQPALGTDGAPSADVLTVQGSPAGMPVTVSMRLGLPLQQCNAVRQTNCARKGW